MLWKKTEIKNQKMEQMNEILKKSFANVKKDTANIFQWLNYFYRKNLEQEQIIGKIQLELSYVPKTREDIRKIIDDYYSFEGMMKKINELNLRVDELSRAGDSEKIFFQPPVAQPQVRMESQIIGMSSIEKRLEKLEQKKASIKEKIIRRITKNSKEYVKGIILSYIKKYEKVSALQLKEIVVDEQSFCSKSSFYRLLEEIEQSEEIGVVKQGKEKSYLYKASKHM